MQNIKHLDNNYIIKVRQMTYPSNLSQLKKYLANNIGTSWTTENTKKNWFPGVRRLALINSVDFGFENDDGRISSCPWPKASWLEFNTTGGSFSFSIHNPDFGHTLTYTLQN